MSQTMIEPAYSHGLRDPWIDVELTDTWGPFLSVRVKHW